jgi:hypothetical protein
VKRLKNARHGDMAGVQRHHRAGTPLCVPCKKAQKQDSDRRREREAARRAEKPEKPKVDLGPSLARIREYLDAREAM